MKKYLLIIYLFFINGCGIIQSYNVYQTHKNAKETDFGNPPSKEAIQGAENNIRFRYKDPDSVKFIWQTPYKCVYPNGFDTITGYCANVNVNAKNGFGGYIGYNQWITMWTNNHLINYVYAPQGSDLVKAF